MMDSPEAALGTATIDPRIRRSRDMLHAALATLLETKNFDRISIQDIAQTATLNRATFYDHYPDKYALLQCMVGSRFGELLARRDVRVNDCAGALRAIARCVCDYLAETPTAGGSTQDGSMQAAIVGVIREMLRDGLRDHPLARDVSGDVVAATLSWAIYGAASAWVRSPQRCSSDEMAAVIDRLVKPILAAAAAAEARAPLG